jgi:vitamin B12 transporter
VGGTLGYTYKPGQTLTLQTFQSTVNGGYDMGMPYFNDRGVQTLSSNMLTSRNVISSLWTSTLRAGFSIDDYKTVGASASSLDGTQYFKTRQNQYVWQNDLKFSPTQVVSLAYERLEQSVDGTLSNGDYLAPAFVNYQQTSRYTNSLLTIYRGNWGPQSVQASARTDNNSQYGNFVTGSLTYGLDLSKNWRASVGANTGFRAPNFNELYWPVTPFFMGNPLLQPEKSRNIEAGLRYTTDKTQLGLTVYRNEISNLILNQPSIAADPYSAYTPTNIGRATIQGVTFTGNQRLGSSTLVRGSVDWLDPRNADTGELLPQRAQQVLKLAVDQSIGRARLTAELYATSTRRDSFSGDTLAGFNLVNLAASYPMSEHAEVQLRWNNVFGQQYTLVQGYNTPGSNVFMNLALRM